MKSCEWKRKGALGEEIVVGMIARRLELHAKKTTRNTQTFSETGSEN